MENKDPSILQSDWIIQKYANQILINMPRDLHFNAFIDISIYVVA